MTRRIALLILLLVLTGCEPQQPGPTLTAYHAAWCQQCLRDKPRLDLLRPQISVIDVDIDATPTPGVTNLPLYIIEINGEHHRTSDIRTVIRILRTLHAIRS